MKRFLKLAVALACFAVSGVHAQSFPDRAVRIILPFPTGTGPDTVMRAVGDRLSKLWGKPVVVDNRPGANGWIAIEAVKRAAPDGYTLGQVDASQATAHPHLFKRLPFDPEKDFEPVATLYRTYYYVTVAADSKWNTVGDLIAAAKAQPGQVAYGSSGMGGNLHLGGAMMERASGTQMNHIPFKETTQIYTSIANGDIHWAVGTASTTQPLLKAGKLKYLAVTAPERVSLFPQVPTVAEAKGPQNYELQTWVALLAPRGTPREIVQRINADVAKVMQEPEMRERLTAVAFEAVPQSPEALRGAMARDSAMFKSLIQELKITLD